MTMSRNNAGTSDEKEPQSLRSGKNVSQRVGVRASRFFYHAAFFTPSILDFTVFNQFTQDNVGANIQVRAAFFSFNLFWCYRIRKVLQRILIRRHKARIFRIHAAYRRTFRVCLLLYRIVYSRLLIFNTCLSATVFPH